MSNQDYLRQVVLRVPEPKRRDFASDLLDEALSRREKAQSELDNATAECLVLNEFCDRDLAFLDSVRQAPKAHSKKLLHRLGTKREDEAISRIVFKTLSDGKARTMYELAEELNKSVLEVRGPLYGALKGLLVKIKQGKKTAFKLVTGAVPPWHNRRVSFPDACRTLLAENPNGLTSQEILEELEHLVAAYGNTVRFNQPISNALYVLTHVYDEAIYDSSTKKFRLKDPASAKRVEIPTREELPIQPREHKLLPQIRAVFERNDNRWLTISEIAAQLNMNKSLIGDCFREQSGNFEMRDRVGKDGKRRHGREFRMAAK